jgi:RNA polymerase sigma-70 factor (ECF subfamily)
MSPAPPAGIPDAFWRDPVERAKTDPAAFGELYDRYSARIFRFVRSRIHDDGLAEDVTADVFMSALRGIKNYQDQGRPFSCWLYRIAANAVASHYRSRRPQLSLDDAVDLAVVEIDPADEVVDRERARAVWQAVDRLPPQQRAAMILKFSDDLTMEDIGAILGKSSAAAKLLIYRAVQRLRLELAPAVEEIPIAARGESTRVRQLARA